MTHYPRPSAHYGELLSQFNQIKHSIIEIIECNSAPCIPDESQTGNERRARIKVNAMKSGVDEFIDGNGSLTISHLDADQYALSQRYT